MGKFTYSPDQIKIITSRNENLLVSAAAGSGKTAVLVERIIRRVLDEENPVDIDRILVVTFTNAAAKEMKERISQAIEDKLKENPNDSNLQRQSALVHNALITTIDSFCLYLIRNHFHRIGIDPSFRPADANETNLLKQDILEKILSEKYESGDENFYHLADCYSKKDNDDTIQENILKLYDFSRSYPWSEEWLEKRKNDYKYDSFESFKNSDNIVNLISDFKNELSQISLANKEALLIYEKEKVPDPKKDKDCYGKALDADKNLINALEETEDFSKIAEILSTDFASLGNVGKRVSAEGVSAIKPIRDNYKNLLISWKQDVFYMDLENIFNDIIRAGQTVSELVDLTLIFLKEYDKAKRERNIVDFQDMEHMAIDILLSDFKDINDYEITDVANEYRNYFAEVYVDEYQDSNLVQEIILRSISREDEEGPGNRFMVGDVKQSIYRFRLARPEIFMEKVDHYSEKEGSRDRLILLKENYRSRKGVINSVNAVFENIMTRERGGADYNENTRLNAAANYEPLFEDETGEILLIPHEKISKVKNEENEIRAIAEKIKSIVGKMQIFDKDLKKNRPLSYKDIAILFKSVKHWDKTLTKVFKQYGIPYYSEAKGAFYDAKEVQTIINFLRVINNPLEDIPLFGTMLSYFGGFTDSECALIKAGADTETVYLWDKLKNLCEKEPENEKLNNFITMINKYRSMVYYMPIGELLNELINSTGYDLYISALSDGEQRLANIRLLVRKALQYGKTSFYGLFHFIRYIELIKESKETDSEADILSDNADVVRIMTIHKSKGLEFPVTFIGGMETSLSDMDLRKAFIYDIEKGIGASYINPTDRIKRKTLHRRLIENRIKKEAESENIRLLYVAMTRAREKLYMVGLYDNPETFPAGNENDKFSNFFKMIQDAVSSNSNLFKITIVDKPASLIEETDNLLNRDTLKAKLKEEAFNEEENQLYETVKNRFSYDYSHKDLLGLYTKTTVSELKMKVLEENEGESCHLISEHEPIEKIPSFTGKNEGDVTGTQRGTAYHKLLSLLDFSQKLDDENLNTQVIRLCSQNTAHANDLKLVPLNKIRKFLHSDLAERMKKAQVNKKLYKEQPFVLGIPASRVNDSFSLEETLLIQGVIDVFFEEDNEIILMDYKTDKVEKAEELINRYKIQLDYYKEALERITEKKVKEKLIYSFSLDCEIKVP